MTPPAISIRDLTVAYGDTVAVDGVTLDIAEGSFTALVGLSGSGKSTLLKAVNRLVEADRGTVAVNGAPNRSMAPPRLRRGIGYVFQNIGLFPHMTVGRNIAMPLELAGEDGREARVAELLDLVSLPRDYADRLPGELSGGQQQRVGVARALASRPDIMLMDEPFGALDPMTRAALTAEYRALHDRLGLTSVMVTHDMAEALELATRVLVLDGGRIVGDASPAELLAGQGGDAAQALVAVPRAQAALFRDAAA